MAREIEAARSYRVSSNGFTQFTPVPSTSLVLRVASVSPWTFAVAPYRGCFQVDGEDPFPMVADQPVEPNLQRLRPCCVTATDELDPTTQLPDRQDTQEDLVRGERLEP